MPANALTARTLETLKPPPTGRTELTDSAVPGLKFRLTANGAASWSLQVRVNGEKRRFTICEYPAIGLAKAREEARRLRVEARQGRDPIREQREAKVAKAAQATVGDILELYASLHLRPNLRTAGERERQLKAALAKHLDRPIGELTRGDIQQAIDAKASEGRKVAANRIRAALVAFANWCWQRGHTSEHIGDGTTRAAKEAPRERVLTLDEVRQVYAASYDLGPLWGPLYRLRILTAQRLGDIAKAEWADIDFEARRYSIPGSRTKNGKPHIVHLSAPALAELEAMKSQTGETPFVFTTTGTTPVSGFGKVNAKLYKLAGVSDWRPHDFRTAFASALCEAGEDEAVVDRILNHSASSSAPSAVARVYNRASKLPQRAAALDRWAGMVTGE
jgi:integrase